MKIVYGPVPSRRLGRSLGIDPVCRKDKTCSFDCVYCQLGSTKNKTSKQETFITQENLEKELTLALQKAKADIVTFSGSGEPTLAENLNELVDTVKKLTNLPVAILTNSSMFHLEGVRNALKKFDVVVAKLDASNSEVFNEINKPANGITFEETFESIKQMRKEFQGKKFALQCMFLESNKNSASEIASLAKEINPDEVQLDTPLRHCAVKPISEKEMKDVKNEFSSLNAVSIYDLEKPKVEVLDLKETLSRRPEL